VKKTERTWAMIGRSTIGHVFCSLVLVSFAAAADTVELTTGEHVEGIFRQASAATGVVIETGGQAITIPFAKVRAIYLGAAKPAPVVRSAASPWQEALDAVRGLRSVTDSGISYSEYARRVLDAKVIVDKYVVSSKPAEAQSKLPLDQTTKATQIWSAINSAMFSYDHASQMWNLWLTSDGSAREILRDKLGPIEKQLNEAWKRASAQVAEAEELTKH
jgi:hypothetical protein